MLSEYQVKTADDYNFSVDNARKFLSNFIDK